MVLKVLTTIALALSLSSGATLEGIYEVLKYSESNGITTAIGDNGKAYGIVQIHKSCVDDVNRIYGTSYTHEEMFDEACAKEVFVLYLQAGIDRYVNKHGVLPTEEQVVRMWNGGIYKGHLYRDTIKYYRRYIRFKNMCL